MLRAVHGPFAEAAVVVQLGEGTTDAGEIEPVPVALPGRIDADFPLDDALLWAWPAERALRDEDGAFVLTGVDLAAREVALRLYSQAFGGFEATLPVIEGALPTWHLQAEQAATTVPTRALPADEAGDSG